MKLFKLITDSGCDLSYEIINSLDIGYLGLECNIEGINLKEDGGQSLNYKTFYEKLLKGTIPKTSQINPSRFIKEFEKCINNDLDILYISLSSGLSGTYNSALAARKELVDKHPETKIIIIDSKAASSGQGLLVYMAALLKEKGMNIDEIKEFIETTRERLYHFFTVSDLKYLEMGGRISISAAIIGSMFNIYPILTVNSDGELELIGKVRGEKKVLKELVRKISDNVLQDNIDTLFISHADNEKSVKYVCDRINDKFKVNKILVNYMGLAIGSHTGQGAIGVFFLGNVKNTDSLRKARYL